MTGLWVVHEVVIPGAATALASATLVHATAYDIQRPRAFPRTARSPAGLRPWPAGNGNGWANSGGQDLTLVDDMLKQLEGDLCVDTTRIFAMGFSYGGGMSYAIACARATVFRAVAVYSGAQLSGCTGGNDPIAYIGIHGISDGTCNISGGRSLRDRFVKNNTCTAQNPPEPSSGSGKHTCTSYAGCSSGHPVRWCAFDGGHTPGNVDGGGDDGAKTWTKSEAWQFFTQF